MRDCKIWLGLPRNYNGDGTFPCRFSSLVLQDTIKREMRGAKTHGELIYRFDVMEGNLRKMLIDDELSPRSHKRLMNLLISEYKKRYEVLNE